MLWSSASGSGGTMLLGPRCNLTRILHTSQVLDCARDTGFWAARPRRQAALGVSHGPLQKIIASLVRHRGLAAATAATAGLAPPPPPPLLPPAEPCHCARLILRCFYRRATEAAVRTTWKRQRRVWRAWPLLRPAATVLQPKQTAPRAPPPLPTAPCLAWLSWQPTAQLRWELAPGVSQPVCGLLLCPVRPACCRFAPSPVPPLTGQPTCTAAQGWGHLPAPLLGDVFRRLLDQQYNVEDVVRTWQVSLVFMVPCAVSLRAAVWAVGTKNTTGAPGHACGWCLCPELEGSPKTNCGEG